VEGEALLQLWAGPVRRLLAQVGRQALAAQRERLAVVGAKRARTRGVIIALIFSRQTE
jgi:hypothetical protein